MALGERDYISEFANLCDFHVPIDAALRHPEPRAASVLVQRNAGGQSLPRHGRERRPGVVIRIILNNIIVDLCSRLVVASADHHETAVRDDRVRVRSLGGKIGEIAILERNGIKSDDCRDIRRLGIDIAVLTYSRNFF